MTRASAGAVVWLRSDAVREKALHNVVRGLLEAVRRGPVAQQDQLMLHSTAWELGLGLSTEPSFRDLACDLLALLRATAFTRAEADRLPSTMHSVLDQIEAPELEGLLGRVLRAEGAAEVLPPSDQHSETLLARFAPRLFVSAWTDAERQRLLTYLFGSPRYEHLGILPLRFADVESVLVLYWNVLSPQLKILSTQQIAFVQYYRFSGRSKADLRRGDRAVQVNFNSVHQLRHSLQNKPIYHLQDQQQVARAAFLDVMPAHPGVRAVTRDAHCLACHQQVMETFHPEFARPVRLVLPESEPAPQELGPYALNIVEPALARWASACGAR